MKEGFEDLDDIGDEAERIACGPEEFVNK